MSKKKQRANTVLVPKELIEEVVFEESSADGIEFICSSDRISEHKWESKTFYFRYEGKLLCVDDVMTGSYYSEYSHENYFEDPHPCDIASEAEIILTLMTPSHIEAILALAQAETALAYVLPKITFKPETK